jgi:apolipoprotein N-acyltransferase
VILGAALYGLAFPPFDFSSAAWVALVPLLLALRGLSPARAFGLGFLYGYGCAAAVAGWLVQTLGRFFGFPLPLAFLIGSAYAAAFWGTAFGLFAAGTSLLLRERSLARRLAVPALWVATELLRGRVLGQPWGLLGYSQHASVGLLQMAAVTAVYGLSFALALSSLGVADALVFLRERRPRHALAALALPAALVLPLWGMGTLLARRGPVGGFTAHPVAVVQTNVAPARDWTRAYTDRQMQAHVAATDELPATPAAGLIVWPENAIPRYLEEEPMIAARLGEIAVRRGADLLFGGPRYEDGRTFNSVRLITSQGRYGGHYDKQRLVLFAEADPFAAPEAAGPSENPHRFSAGSAPGVLESFVPVGVSICHEILFPELTARAVRAGAALLVNVSNDGWLDAGRGVASRQHFAMAVVRAVETRRYLVRAATTGVSGVVDPYGHVLDALPPGAAGVLTLPVAGRSEITPYVQLGDLFAMTCVLAVVVAFWRRRTAPVLDAAPARDVALPR